MPNGQPEQRNSYKGNPLRAWVTVTFEKADGTGNAQKELVADLGDPTEGVISQDNLRQLKVADAPAQRTNWGLEERGWVCINMPELGLEK